MLHTTETFENNSLKTTATGKKKKKTVVTVLSLKVLVVEAASCTLVQTQTSFTTIINICTLSKTKG